MRTTSSAKISSQLGPLTHSTGTVWVDEIVSGGSPQLKVTRVTFTPGARTAWHMHPLGQALHVISGSGWVQVKGEPAKMMCPGDSVWIDADELHWHGASVGHLMVHLSFQGVDQGVEVVWLGRVTDAEYANAAIEKEAAEAAEAAEDCRLSSQPDPVSPSA